MNLSEGLTFVLKNRGQKILQDFLREDLAAIIGSVISDGARLFREGQEGVKNFNLKSLPGDIAGSAAEIAQLVKILPARIRKGLGDFQSDMLSELEKLKDKKEKALFCFKVFGILTTSTFSTFYNLRNSGKSLSLGKVKLRSAFAQFLLAELVVRAIRQFALRFLAEVEHVVTVEEDLGHISYFRKIMDGEVAGPAVSAEDPAFRVTEKLRNTILNGDDEA